MFISPAFAQDAAIAASDTASAPGMLMSMLPLVLILFVFYLMVIRPQNRRMTEHRTMLNALSKGDRVVTAGGIVGVVTKLVSDDEVTVQIANGVEVNVVRHTIMTKKS